ncbi:hypothetical protein K0M31_016958 [Melipona bicolor]|uniref:Uncharacterized protein n=1 Tax=Melipona bicolor TaxID=60889 RepID=A0AA40KEI9_9HYME|nr:hypothetical protein K0M31_016958 [Melipona bicolor]
MNDIDEVYRYGIFAMLETKVIEFYMRVSYGISKWRDVNRIVLYLRDLEKGHLEDLNRDRE